MQDNVDKLLQWTAAMKVFYALVNLVKVLLFHIVPHSSLFFCVSVTRIAQKVVDLDSDPV